jgi:peptidoglycan/LPS O-acetylase OafA/YrhL
MFAYYIPDGFFFISAFLYTRKIMQLPNGEYSGLFKAFAWKICRLYPLYIVALVIYWGISPALH